MAVEWVALSAAIVKIALRLHEQSGLADAIDDSTEALRRLRASRRTQQETEDRIADALRRQVIDTVDPKPPGGLRV